ncbi:MAG: M16 family metallopeptidase [Candidatus Zixiibacteriota bacterium]
MKYLRLFLICFGLVLCVAAEGVFAQKAETESISFAPGDIIPLDPDITYGKLDNGITYYIKYNSRPENRAEFRLAVNAGSVLEDDDQQGLAHFTEHMAFNGTKNFEKHELIDFLESIGMRFGPELNAYTYFEETMYMLQVPTDSAELVETAFQILEDWAHQLTLADDEIDRERGVIIEEWRLGRGAGARILDKQFPIMLQGSKYAERLPIGKKEVVQDCSYETLKKFYYDWYRPDLMAVVAVGDFDKAEIEKLIKKYFNEIPQKENARPREEYPVPDHKETLFAIATDPEATSASVGVYYKHPMEKTRTVADYRRDIVNGLYNSMLSQRLYELTRLPEPPFLYGYSGESNFVRSKELYTLGAGVEDNGIEKGLEALLIEAERVRKYGFTQTELDRQKKETMRWIEQLYNERDKTESRNLAREYTSNYLNGEAAPGIVYEYELYRYYLPTITLDDVNQVAAKMITDENRVVMVSAPEKPDLKVPGETELLAVFDKVKGEDIKPYEDKVSDKPLLATIPALSKIVAEEYFENLNVTHWTLANGVEVVLKPTDFKNDEILMSASSPGGHSLVPDDQYVSASTAADIISEGGIGTFNRIELEKKLAGKVVRVSPRIGNLSENMEGNCSPEDLETMLQLVYLYFTSPRKDTTAYQAYQAQIQAFLENRGARPETAFFDTLQVTLSQYHPRTRPWTLELMNEMNLDQSYRIYRERFADASDFTFCFVGNIDLTKARPLVETYLGGLPSTRQEESWRDLNINPPDGLVKKEVRKGMEPKSQIQIVFNGDFVWNRLNRYVLTAMVEGFRIKLREVIREDLGGTYGVRLDGRAQKEPEHTYSINIGLGCDPDRVDEIIAMIMTQIDSLKNYGLNETYIEKVKEMQRRERETSLKRNNFWLMSLSSAYSLHEDPMDILDYENLVDQLTVEAVRQAALEYFDTDNYVQVVLYPES